MMLSWISRSRSLPILGAAALLAAAAPAAMPPADLQLELVIDGFDRPIAVRHAADGSGRLFVVEQAGLIWIVEGGARRSQPFLDLTTRVDSSGNEQGLLGLAFHPSFASNGYFYVNYIFDPGPGSNPPDRTRVARYRVSADPNVADPASERLVIEIDQDFGNHNGGDVHFGPDDMLYVGMGDGGSSNDPNNRAQDPGSLLGKMLRLDVDGDDFPADPDRNYAIPPDNPCADELWAMGLRNPWRFSFDRLTGDMLIGDVGQRDYEEIDFQPGGLTQPDCGAILDYGWRCREGSQPNPNLPPCTGGGPFVDPILEYPHGAPDFHCSVTGGFVYRGHVIAGLAGHYLYADLCSRQIWIAHDGGTGTWTTMPWMVFSGSPSSFGEDQAGELYVVDHGGAVYRVASPSSIFTDGFEPGDARAWSQTVP